MDAYRIKDSIAQASVGMSRGNWLDRFWVPLFSASVRPTTAAL
jgi:hypothetical protein